MHYQEMSNFFYAYVGAVYIRNGLPAVQNWISKLIDPMANVNLPGAPGQPGPGFDGAQHPHINAQQGFYTPPPSQPHYAQQNYMGQAQAPPPPLYNPPPLPTTPAPPRSPYGRGGGGSTLSLVTLALVNQTAAQRGFTVTYPAAQEGPPHQPTWTVRCCSKYFTHNTTLLYHNSFISGWYRIWSRNRQEPEDC
ncbi:hypothetical protein BDN70DRAFT_12848 [Pholiota conissans]|uniref:Uncharacterized protein n=1 Tax=Pholiota conissans TaxID=109636 RepID=A0A9P6CZI3_9AGAR|nr:hypothetical protein BDN70DRAFT_12848 [Pholiota conissans]